MIQNGSLISGCNMLIYATQSLPTCQAKMARIFPCDLYVLTVLHGGFGGRYLGIARVGMEG